MKESSINRFWQRAGGPAWPLDVRSVGVKNDLFPFSAERPSGADFFIIMWTTAGRGELKAGATRYILKKEYVFILPPGVPHSYGTVKQVKSWEKWWLTIDGATAADFMRGLHLNRVLVRRIGAPPLLLFKRLATMSAYPGVSGAMDRAHIALRILYEISARVDQRYRGNPAARYGKIADWVNANIDSLKNVDAMAKRAGITRSHFSRTFTESMGITPKQFLLEAKLNRAKDLLMRTPLKIKEIAYASGWCDPAHFCRQFYRLTGFSPTQYRAMSHI